MKIYIACALTHVPRDSFQEYAAFIHRLANATRSVESVSQVKYALVDSDPQLASKPFSDQTRLCDLWDREMVEEANLVTAELTYPSMVSAEPQSAFYSWPSTTFDKTSIRCRSRSLIAISPIHNLPHRSKCGRVTFLLCRIRTF